MSTPSPEPRLKTGIWVDALIRRAQSAGAFACVTQRGDRDAGTVMVCVRGRDSLALYTPERNMNGQRVWREDAVDEPALSARIAQRLAFDPDLMVVDIDDAAGRHFIEEPVEPLAAPVDEADAGAAARALFRDR